MVKFLKWRALYKLGGLPDACQGLGDKRAGLLGRWRLIPPALDRFGHDRMAGGVIAFRGPLGGMGVGDGGARQVCARRRLCSKSPAGLDRIGIVITLGAAAGRGLGT